MFIAVRHRTAGSPSVYFGPFESVDAVRRWAEDNNLGVLILELNEATTPIPLEAWM